MLEGELDVSDDITNIFASMAATQTLKYVPVEKATKRELGVEGVATDPQIVKDSAGHFKEVPGPKQSEADTTTDLRVELAMQRLALAADMGQVMSFEKHEEMRLLFQKARLEVPPPGYAKVSWAQVQKAHKEVWAQLAVLCEGKVAPVGGVKPLDGYLTQVLVSRQVQACLMYLPAPAGKPPSADSQPGPGPGNAGGGGGKAKLTKAERKRKQLEKAADLARAEERAKHARYQDQPPGGGHQQKGKGKGGKYGKGAGGSPPIPKALYDLGCVARQGEQPICFAYNLPGGCPNAAAGGRCPKGLHICAKCFLTHAAVGNH